MSTKQRGAFSPIVMIVLTVVGAFAFAAYFTLSAFAPELQTGRDGRAHALSQSAVGFAGAVRLARARGDRVEIGRTPGDQLRADSLVVLAPPHPIDLERLTEAAGASTLVILPKWVVGPHPTRRGWVASAGAFDPASVALFVEGIAPGITVAQDDGRSAPRLQDGDDIYQAGPIAHLQTIAGPNLEPVLVDQAGRIVLAAVLLEDAPEFYILSDPDFLNTQGVRNIATARTGMAILDLTRWKGQPIVFDVTLNGLGAARSALRLAFEPPFLGATLGVAIIALLLAWRAAARFGPSSHSLRAIPLGKAALADNSAALIRLTNRERKMGHGYARLIAAQIAESFGAGRREEGDSIAWLDGLAAKHNLSPPFSALVSEAANARSRNEMLEAARKLHAWKEEMKRATR